MDLFSIFYSSIVIQVTGYVFLRFLSLFSIPRYTIFCEHFTENHVSVMYGCKIMVP